LSETTSGKKAKGKETEAKAEELLKSLIKESGGPKYLSLERTQLDLQ
jgi:hypothetical protein